MSLGQAYIATNQTDKGMAAFEKAISLSATPLTWNNIAYALAEQNVQLERADGYADTAITALETQLRDVTLDNLRLQDLGTTQLLFAVWDTKGWIEFKRGKLDRPSSIFCRRGRPVAPAMRPSIWERLPKSKESATRRFMITCWRWPPKSASPTGAGLA